ncbi:TadE/TadG family type IV pilus assembly protein [Sphingomonas sp. Root241]|uniref:TadE/TadG family type IV pilus assembly protein n=1 Tax=Sphingomonas sp. Root241 TaxID=1736501 RepID=UPI00138EECB6|nr:TadE/TadG family type IV pilus assembly protein [Sphingomonas sp. Root241]
MRAKAFLTEFARDTRANTLAIMAMAIIPLAGMVGGGIDISRMYIVKTRLQHGCDAGALAGRKAMAGGNWVQTVNGVANYPETTAKQFFDSNFDKNAYGGTSPNKAFTENAGKVSGTATATVPMTLMRIFGRTTETLTVTCEADMRLPNTDVMFVLDNTGSMDWKPDNSSCDASCKAAGGSKMQMLRVAVKCFFEIVARLDTDAACDGGAPSGGTGNGAQIRFGFVPYSVNVNVGKLLPNEFFADSGYYQTRKWNLFATPQDAVGTPYWETYGTAISQANCLKFMNNQSFNGFTPTPTPVGTAPGPVTKITFNSDGSASTEWYGEWGGWSGASVTSGNNRSCRRNRTDTVTHYQGWTYDRLPINFSALKAGGSNWNNSFTWPDGANGSNRQINWDGCIEERKTVKDAASYNPAPADAYDLDIDMRPNGNAETQWKPALRPLIYLRAVTGGNYSNATLNPVDSINNFAAPGYGCPTQAKKLQSWPVASAFDDYVDSLNPTGSTYHDIGMIWGARLMSPTGIFRSENEFTPQGGEIERHMIFFTDGIAQANPCEYSAYGVAWFDRRTTENVGNASSCGNENANLDAQINKRLEGLCTAVKNKNITLWVISFGAGVDATTKTRLTNCASAGRFFDASDSTALQKAFRDIANQISALRLTN